MTTHCGFCAIIGAPNAGKSTLTNALVGSKVAIVSPKVQTTRMAVKGVAMAGQGQAGQLQGESQPGPRAVESSGGGERPPRPLYPESNRS